MEGPSEPIKNQEPESMLFYCSEMRGREAVVYFEEDYSVYEGLMPRRYWKLPGLPQGQISGLSWLKEMGKGHRVSPCS